MSNIEQNAQLRAILSQAHWQVRPERFVVVGLEPREQILVVQLLSRVTSAFIQFLVEPGRLTLILPEQDWREFRPAFPRARIQKPYRIISFTADLPDNLVGFLAAVTSALADAGIPLLAVCGYSKDHVMVLEEDIMKAQDVIEGLVERVQNM